MIFISSGSRQLRHTVSSTEVCNFNDQTSPLNTIELGKTFKNIAAKTRDYVSKCLLNGRLQYHGSKFEIWLLNKEDERRG